MMLIAILIACAAIDGDTIRCGSEHIRLLAIDAPEMPGHCRKGRHCAPGDPITSKVALQQDLRAGQITIERINVDRYGRTVGDVMVNGQSLSCLQLSSGHAIYWKRYDRGRRIARECGLP